MYASVIKLLAVLFLICTVRGNSASSESDNNSSESNKLDLTGRIYGGRPDWLCEANYGRLDWLCEAKYGYVARLFVTFGRGQSITVCSGTVISEREILTAAHCLSNNGVKARHIWAQVNGTNHLIETKDMYVPSSFRGLSNDIGLIKVSFDQFFLDKYPLLPRGLKPDFENSEAVIAGWGLTSDTFWSPFSSQVQYANVTITSHGICRKHFPVPHVMCTMSVKKTCAGDSGGPLLFTANKRTYVIGVTALGPISCNSNVEPTAYTAVQPNIAWITSVLPD